MANTFLERLQAERAELSDKLEKLTPFLAKPDAVQIVGREQFELLTKQKEVMGQYLEILDKRLELLA